METVKPDLETEILRAWGVGELQDVAVPPVGVSNHTRVVRTERERFVLRGYRHRHRSRIEAEHGTIAHVRVRGIPAPEVVPLPDGQTVLERAGRFWALFRHVEGRQVRRPRIAPQEVAAMGGMLARVHAALADHPQQRVCRTLAAPDLARTMGLIERIEQAIGRMPDAGPREQCVLERLGTQRRWLRQCFAPLHVPAPVQVIHCDYQEGNVVFDGQRVAAVLDWDDSGPGPRSYDVLRAMHLMLSLAPGPCRVFLEAYRQILPLGDDELHSGAVFYGQHRDCSTWLYEEAYLLDNDRVRRQFRPEPFEPFERSWQVFVEAVGLAPPDGR